MRQRLGLAHALLGDPEILILDEPANGLDPEGMRWMRGLLRGFADRGGTVLLSSHLLAEVEAVADRIMIIGGGRIQAQGTRAELLTESGTIVEAADLAALDAALHRAGLTMHPADGDRRLVEAEPEVVAHAAMAGGVVLRRLARPRTRASNASSSSDHVRRKHTVAAHPFDAPRADRSNRMSATTLVAPIRVNTAGVTHAPASAASSPSSCARWSTPAPASGYSSPPSRSPCSP